MIASAFAHSSTASASNIDEGTCIMWRIWIGAQSQHTTHTRDPRLTRGVVEHRADGPDVVSIKEDERPRHVQRKVLGLVAAAHDG